MTLRQAAQTSEVPAPAGPYSPAVRIGSIATSAGHGGATPDETMPDDISGQVGQALRNVLASLAAVGASAGDVAQIRVYLTEREHFAPMNQVYKTFFEEPYPARTTVYVGLPPGMLVEIDALAVLPAGS